MGTEASIHNDGFVQSIDLEKESFRNVAALFTLFSCVDLLATLRLLPFGIHEGNQLADFTLTHFGPWGFALYKLLLVSVVLLVLWIVNGRNQQLALRVLWGGVAVMVFIACYHLAILSGMFFSV